MDAAGDRTDGGHTERGEDQHPEARQESFDFLGYTFGPHHYREGWPLVFGASPSKKSVHASRQKWEKS